MQTSPLKALLLVSLLPASLALLQAAGLGTRESACTGPVCESPRCLTLAPDNTVTPPSPQSSKVDKAGLAAIRGRIQYVDSFPDYKVKAVDSFEDLAVQIVTSFPDAPGKWQIVDSFPDYKIQMVDSFPDFTVKFVDSFPGVR